VTAIKELSVIASTNHDTSPCIVKFSHIQVLPHSSITLQKFDGGSGVGGFATVDMML
jgi:hypothetical protein